jgi:DNA-binding beta-propeller fold protein YncE
MSQMNWLTGAIVGALMVFSAAGSLVARADPPLILESKIPLGDVQGRIDHLAIDLGRHHLFVAELGNDSLGVLDIAAGTVLRRISGLGEPQGVAYSRSHDLVYVASADTGDLLLFHGDSFTSAGSISLGMDADNVRIEPSDETVYVGYGSGAIAVIDPVHAVKLADIPLPAHPEGFQLDPDSANLFVNVPEAHTIVVADRTTMRAVSAWSPPPLEANFPMVLDDTEGEIIVAFRRPAQLVSFSEDGGKVRTQVETCDDADDVFIDQKRKRVYVTCGNGFVDVFQRSPSGYDSIGRVATFRGARTGLFAPELDRLYVAVRARGTEGAAIWVFRPND